MSWWSWYCQRAWTMTPVLRIRATRRTVSHNCWRYFYTHTGKSNINVSFNLFTNNWNSILFITKLRPCFQYQVQMMHQTSWHLHCLLFKSWIFSYDYHKCFTVGHVIKWWVCSAPPPGPESLSLPCRWPPATLHSDLLSIDRSWTIAWAWLPARTHSSMRSLSAQPVICSLTTGGCYNWETLSADRGRSSPGCPAESSCK